MAVRFDWYPDKAAKNKRDHGVAFEQEITVFDDSGAMEGYDIGHSEGEDRFTRIGRSDMGVLVIVFTERRDKILRIISARRADRQEDKLYYEYQAH